MLYEIEAPTGAVTVIVPVGTIQFGCAETDAVGMAGGAGIALTVKFNGAEMQPDGLSFAVIE